MQPGPNLAAAFEAGGQVSIVFSRHLPSAFFIRESNLTTALCRRQLNLAAALCRRQLNLAAALCRRQLNLVSALCSRESWHNAEVENAESTE